METSSVSKVLFAFCLALYLSSKLINSSVTYDRKAIIINGQRRILFSGSIHYPRSTPDMWEDLIQKGKEGGLDVIETYVFWNVHEPSQGNYNFEGRYDLVRFIKTIQNAGLYAHLRIGPYFRILGSFLFSLYISDKDLRILSHILPRANENIGFPVWLKYVPGISFRTDNEPFKRAMQGFTEKIVGMMKSENLFESQGGPIILSQIENEYGAQSKLLGADGQNYVKWAAKMAVELGTGVPWVMCKEDDAPDPVMRQNKSRSKVNRSDLDSYILYRFTEFGGPIHKRPVQDLAFAVAQFVTKGGSFINYYMYHGGTNFGRTAGGPFITTSYDYDAPLDEYGLISEPKYGHLKELHRAIKMCERALVSTDPIVTSLGEFQQADVYYSESGDCAAFLSNHDSNSSVRVLFNNMHYNLPPWSISVLPDCRNVVFNTAKVGVQTSQMQMLPTNNQMFLWESVDEDITSMDDSAVTAPGLLEQINVTRDTSDYLWYITSVDIGSSESFLRGGETPTLIVQSTGHAVHVFINGQLSGSAFGTREYRRFKYVDKVNLRAGTNRIALLSVAVGLPNVGGSYETWNTGILGPVELHGLDQGNWDLSRQKWTYQTHKLANFQNEKILITDASEQVGLKGEAMDIVSPNGISSVQWMQSAIVINRNQPLTWHKTYFDAPDGDEPLALDMEGMGKGQIWINGQSIGRYWTAFAIGNCNDCNYAGGFRPAKCQFGCGQPTQRWYHVPRSWLKPTQNLLRSVSSVCADVTEYHPNIKNWHIESYGKAEKFHPAKVHLHCSPGQTISSIKFASFGTPLGTCGNYKQGPCHSPTSYAILEKKCIGKQRCAVTVTNSIFGDPCSNVLKRLSVEAVCFATN
ncbi:hypothetical protein Lal_00012263 [Lupinus albus]|nr:hypothetical protein Lal_00012263 [Lupinus albus]